MCPVDSVKKVYAMYDGAFESEAAERSFTAVWKKLNDCGR